MKLREVEKDEPGNIEKALGHIYLMGFSLAGGILMSVGAFYLNSGWYFAQSGAKFIFALTGTGVLTGIFSFLAVSSMFNIGMPKLFNTKTIVKEYKEAE